MWVVRIRWMCRQRPTPPLSGEANREQSAPSNLTSSASGAIDIQPYRTALRKLVWGVAAGDAGRRPAQRREREGGGTGRI